MSSVIVKGMKMPENCSECPVALSGEYCSINKTYTTYIKIPIRPNHCPLIALPDHHGRLVDADALCEDLLERWSVAETRKEELIKAVMADVVTPIIACQPTIVESEDSE